MRFMNRKRLIGLLVALCVAFIVFHANTSNADPPNEPAEPVVEDGENVEDVAPLADDDDSAPQEIAEDAEGDPLTSEPEEEGELDSDAEIPLVDIDLPVVEIDRNECQVEEPLTLAVHEMVPMVMYEEGELTGFDIDFWNMVAEEIGCDYEPEAVASVGELIERTSTGEFKAGIAGITITAEREEIVDFSLPYYDGGLAIMIENKGANIFQMAAHIVNTEGFNSFVIVVVFIYFLLPFLIWLIERLFHPTKKDREDGNISRRFWPGYGEAQQFIHCSVTTIGEGYFSVRSWPARYLMMPMSYVGFAVIGTIIGFFGAISFNSAQIAQMENAEDLVGHSVAVVGDTTSDFAVQAVGVSPVRVSDDTDGFNLVLQGSVEALVFDKPTLDYLAQHEGEGRVVVTDTFTTERYGVVLPPDSPLKEPVNRAILTIMQDGRYDLLMEKYFGTDE